ncbi:hypothetical protein ACP70R_023651 [Stipagrostis hirtigluma subsp. patula]
MPSGVWNWTAKDGRGYQQRLQLAVRHPGRGRLTQRKDGTVA